LSFCFDPASADAFGKRNPLWRMGALPPIADCMVLGELACAAAGGEADVGLCEVAVLLASRLTHTAGGTREDLRISAADRRRAVRAALWLDARTADETVDLSGAAAQAHLSSYHFLRVFSRVFGVTPHQYLIRRRLARAARLLASEPLGVTQIGMMVGFNDVSHFVRSFRRHAGKTPSQFRALARGERRSLERAIQPPTG
jgi:AraC-like DNA-binding protein